MPFVYFHLMLWIVPPFWGPEFLAYYFGVIYMLRTTALTCVAVPYNTLSAEMTQNYDERTKLSSYRYI
jgi:GPH family glycoside/pentoside/hexuronide:cation symporter